MRIAPQCQACKRACQHVISQQRPVHIGLNRRNLTHAARTARVSSAYRVVQYTVDASALLCLPQTVGRSVYLLPCPEARFLKANGQQHHANFGVVELARQQLLERRHKHMLQHLRRCCGKLNHGLRGLSVTTVPELSGRTAERSSSSSLASGTSPRPDMPRNKPPSVC